MSRKKLSDVLQTSAERDRLRQLFDDAKPAEEFPLVPAGNYLAEAVRGECFHARKNGTLGYKVTFQKDDFETVPRLFWYDLWLTEAAMPKTKRELEKLGITDFKMLDSPLPRGTFCTLRVVIRKDDEGNEWNEVKSFEVSSVDRPKPDPFAPASGEGQSDGVANRAAA